MNLTEIEAGYMQGIRANYMLSHHISSGSKIDDKIIVTLEVLTLMINLHVSRSSIDENNAFLKWKLDR